jgi:hypothetical protein
MSEYFNDDGDPITMQYVDLESAGYVPNVGDGFRTTFTFRGHEYRIIPAADKDKLAHYRGLVPCDPQGNYILHNNPHWYYWHPEKQRWMEHYVPSRPAEVVPIRPGIPVLPGHEVDESELTFAGKLDAVLDRLGGVAWIEALARTDPWKFLNLMGKTIPLEVKGMESDKSVTVQVAVLGPDGTETASETIPNTTPPD